LGLFPTNAAQSLRAALFDGKSPGIGFGRILAVPQLAESEPQRSARDFLVAECGRHAWDAARAAVSQGFHTAAE